MLPDGAVRQKMMSDGILSNSEINDFFGTPEDSAPPPSQPYRTPAPAPARPPAPAPASAGSRRDSQPGSLLEAIQQGAKLKAVQRDDSQTKKPAPTQNAGGMLNMLAAAMSQRRNFVKDLSDDESDSDGGFSDSDSD